MDSPGSCAEFGGTVFCAFQGAGGAVTVATMVGKAWQRVTTIPGAATPATPALAVLDNQLICVYQSNGSVHVSYLSTSGTWSPDAFIELDDGQYLDGIYGSPALVVFNDMLFCFYQLYDHTGNLRVATYDGMSWVQVGGKKVNLSKIVPGMAFSPTAAVFLGKIYVLYQKYGGDGDVGNGTLTGATFDGVATWTSLGDIFTAIMTASPAVAVGADNALKVDQSDQAWLWNATANVVMVSLPETPWLQFAGRWGDTASVTASSPDPPAAQGWFIPRSDGPAG